MCIYIFNLIYFIFFNLIKFLICITESDKNNQIFSLSLSSSVRAQWPTDEMGKQVPLEKESTERVSKIKQINK